MLLCFICVITMNINPFSYVIEAASSQIIYPQFRESVTNGQAYLWRIQNLCDNVQKKYTLEELTNMMDLDYDKDNILDEKTELEVKHNLISNGNIGNIVMLDCSFMCNNDIAKILPENILILRTNIGDKEINYKFENKERYPEIDFDLLGRNIDYLNRFSNIKTNIEAEHHILQELETFHINERGWTRGDRNEINDRAQVEILYRIKSIFGCNVVLLTDDKEMVRKAEAVEIEVYTGYN